jgi:hypothetical protein
MGAQRCSHSQPAVLFVVLTLAALGVAAFAGGPQTPPPVRVKIEDGSADSGEVAVDAPLGCQVIAGPNMSYSIGLDKQNPQPPKVYSWFNTGGKETFPGNSGVEKVINGPLPRRLNNRKRVGHTSVWEVNQFTVTQEIEVVASTGHGGTARRRDAVLVTYLVHNQSKQARQLGLRVHTDQFDPPGLAFAGPNEPRKLLDGIELKGAKVPRSLRMLTTANAKPADNAVARITCDLGSAFEQPTRIVLTQKGAVSGWDVRPLPSNGNAVLVLYWDTREIKAGGQRKMAYAYGRGVVSPPGGEGAFTLALAGSFTPGKLFTICAEVPDPAVGQYLTLDLPDGMQRVEGKERQPVPLAGEDGHAAVLWKARVQRPGRFDLRVRSSTGPTRTKIVTISPP